MDKVVKIASLALWMGLALAGCGLSDDPVSAGWLPDPELDRDSNSLTVWVTHPSCPAALDSDGVNVEVVESVSSVVLLAQVALLETTACKGPNEAVPVHVELAQPLGPRDLLDGRRQPPQPPVDDFNAGAMPIGG
ncbi:MAG: hypothetical protein GY926_12880 [bacterium]|nr:hypothetical protein [bacterium]